MKKPNTANLSQIGFFNQLRGHKPPKVADKTINAAAYGQPPLPAGAMNEGNKDK